MLKLTNAVWRTLDRINRDINAMPYKSDMEMYGKLEHWNPYDAEAGDCDDYSCRKRQKLREAFPDNHDAFRLATLWVEEPHVTPGVDDYHAVLTVHTDKGVYVLDNRYPEVTPWRDLSYRWHKMEQPGKRPWVLIEQ